MPNHVTTYCVITGTRAELDRFRTTMVRILDGDDEDKLSFRFDTAWSFPGPIFEKLPGMFPTFRFDCTCFDENWCFAGRGAFNGQPAFEIVQATEELHAIVYGFTPEERERGIIQQP